MPTESVVVLSMYVGDALVNKINDLSLDSRSLEENARVYDKINPLLSSLSLLNGGQGWVLSSSGPSWTTRR